MATAEGRQAGVEVQQVQQSRGRVGQEGPPALLVAAPVLQHLHRESLEVVLLARVPRDRRDESGARDLQREARRQRADGARPLVLRAQHRQLPEAHVAAAGFPWRLAVSASHDLAAAQHEHVRRVVGELRRLHAQGLPRQVASIQRALEDVLHELARALLEDLDSRGQRDGVAAAGQAVPALGEGPPLLRPAVPPQRVNHDLRPRHRDNRQRGADADPQPCASQLAHRVEVAETAARGDLAQRPTIRRLQPQRAVLQHAKVPLGLLGVHDHLAAEAYLPLALPSDLGDEGLRALREERQRAVAGGAWWQPHLQEVANFLHGGLQALHDPREQLDGIQEGTCWDHDVLHLRLRTHGGCPWDVGAQQAPVADQRSWAELADLHRTHPATLSDHLLHHGHSLVDQHKSLSLAGLAAVALRDEDLPGLGLPQRRHLRDTPNNLWRRPEEDAGAPADDGPQDVAKFAGVLLQRGQRGPELVPAGRLVAEREAYGVDQTVWDEGDGGATQFEILALGHLGPVPSQRHGALWSARNGEGQPTAQGRRHGPRGGVRAEVVEAEGVVRRDLALLDGGQHLRLPLAPAGVLEQERRVLHRVGVVGAPPDAARGLGPASASAQRAGVLDGTGARAALATVDRPKRLHLGVEHQ
mmetsp:Transcript_99454/g.281506  ORF Transcript_99454/g.281506 Transcript_99454/m.281506 type:complete len:642 (-) Transcript_99454:387-2312(-)